MLCALPVPVAKLSGLFFPMCMLVFQHNAFDSHYGSKFMVSSEIRLFYLLQEDL